MENDLASLAVDKMTEYLVYQRVYWVVYEEPDTYTRYYTDEKEAKKALMQSGLNGYVASELKEWTQLLMGDY